MRQKTGRGKKNEDRWLGPYKILDVLKTTCLLQNRAGKHLKGRVSINQLKPYLHQSSLVEITAGSILKSAPSHEKEDISAAESLVLISQSVPSFASIELADSETCTVTSKGNNGKLLVCRI